MYAHRIATRGFVFGDNVIAVFYELPWKFTRNHDNLIDLWMHGVFVEALCDHNVVFLFCVWVCDIWSIFGYRIFGFTFVLEFSFNLFRYIVKVLEGLC